MREQTMSSTLDSITHRQNWEYLVITVSPDESLAQARRRLVEHAEYGKWELQRSIVYRGGMRRFWMRRRIIRVRSTLS
ncbi:MULTISPECIES: DUF5703 family protein [Micrococcus]|uniref:Uncharacterized protein n=1 Tax=Micrococcus terreus TaxID=574650 RepID=A0A1I7MLT0_9MICC|nr:DUF5703 family protein [Micrococcus terreus]SFV22885.1 hypothetical protein SAMN04487966_10580 [Micrococcus terreus]